MNDQSTLTHGDLRQFTGDIERFRHAINRNVIYTPGIQYLAEKAGAYWLIDEIAIALGSIEIRRAAIEDPRIAELHFWRLTVEMDNSAKLIARADSDVAPFIVRQIPFTDFPFDHIDIWAGFDGSVWTLYLPSEH